MDEHINTKRSSGFTSEDTALPSCFVGLYKKKFQESALMSVRLTVSSSRKLASVQSRAPPLFFTSLTTLFCGNKH